MAEARSLTPEPAASDIKTGLAPVVDGRTRLLILGSLPGDTSLAAGQYYAHPQNGFWRLLGQVLDQDLASFAYPARLAALRQAGVGLWDVIASARRPGSLDAAIREARSADVAALVETLPDLRAVAFNGGAAARLGRGLLDPRRWALIDLPSSSPAHARPFAEKAAAWSALGAWIAP